MSSGNQPERVWIDQIAPIPVTSADPYIASPKAPTSSGGS
jgi:hypothetical protein